MENSRLRRSLSHLVLVGTIICFSVALAACGGSGNSNPETTPIATPGAEPTPEPEEPSCGQEFSSTYDAVQRGIFDRQCIGCHAGDTPSGNLDLSAGNSYDAIFQQPSSGSDLLLVRAGSRSESQLWLKVAAWSDENIILTGGTAMPPAAGLDAESIELLRFWIQNGAPESGTIEGTAERVAGCFPDPEPMQILPLEPPEEGVGVQLVMPNYNLPKATELEVCFCTFENFCDEIPEEYKSSDGKFFYYDRREIRQNTNSHHLLIQAPNAILSGDDDVDPSEFDGWTCNGGPSHGEVCDPHGEACGDGFCQTPVVSTTACGGYAPGNGIITSSFAGTQQPQSLVDLHEGVYARAPCEMPVCWNSHAFNLTNQDTVMNARMNYRFAADRVYLSRGTSVPGGFAIVQLMSQGAKAYTKKTMCWSRTLPRGARVTSFSSHTHQRGERSWWTMPDGETVIYDNRVYNDPPQFSFAEPLEFDSAADADRTLEFCITYNNGVDDEGNPNPETVTRASRIAYGIGGPGSTGPGLCEPYACVNDGADFSIDCDDGVRNQKGDDAICDTTPGAGDGYCDACSIMGGVTTENEMGQGSIQYFVVAVD
jgi:hypothetical protein